MNIHIETVHEGKKPVLCSICNTSFTTKKNLKRHVANVHEGKKSMRKKNPQCLICEKVFPDNNLKRLITSVHEEKRRLKCSVCDKVFTRI